MRSFRSSLRPAARALVALVPLAAALAPATAGAQLTTPLDSATLAQFRWRSVGPAIMAGRVTDIEVDPRDTKTYYVATAAGGIWKTVNNGTTFFPLFDREKVISLGDLAIAPSNPQVLYLGTGEEDSRNSISPGGGVYKSTDAGRTWTYVGLKETEAIGRVVVHPTNPDIVYVAALGHIWGPNKERGLYKTTDGGKTWNLVKFVSDKAGFVELALDPSNPDVIWAASWERVRGPYFLKSGGPGSALWKSTDAGATWTQVRGGGLPTTTLGRIGLTISPSNPKVMYAMVEADTNPNPRKGPPRKAAQGEGVIGLGGSVPRSMNNSGLYRSTDGGTTWTQMYRNEDDARPFYYSQVRVDPKNPDRVYWMSSIFRFSDDGGKTPRRGAIGIHSDYHAMWINPNDPSHYVVGNDGGIAVTYDRGGTYDFINTFPIGQFYAVSYDMQIPYRVCGGLQDNGSWCGPSRTRGMRGATNADWFNVGGGDGFYTAQDPRDPNVIYSESQGGNLSRLDLATNVRKVLVRGGGRNRRSLYEDSMVVARGDTAQPETATTKRELDRLRAAARQDSASRNRYNWSMPFFLSPHNPDVVYAGGNRLMKSVNRGERFEPISPDLSTKDSMRILTSTKNTGGLTPDNTGAETHGTITTVAESPVRPGILWAGTDDGNVWLSRNDGGSWENVTGRFPGVPAKTWVSRVEASGADSGTVYVTFDGHRTNDFAPYVYASSDFGRTFRRITDGLPTDGPNFVHVIREDPHNKHLLFVGTDLGAYVSTDRGARWQKFMTNLPTVPVHDLQIHPRDRELIAGTHGRSIWIVDIAALEQMSDSAMRRPVIALTPKTAYQYAVSFGQSSPGNKLWQAEQSPYGADLWYRIAGGTATTVDARVEGQGDAQPRRGAARDSARILITDVKGDTVRVLAGPAGPGLHRVSWDMRGRPAPLGPAARKDSVENAARQKQRDDSTRAAMASGNDTTAAGRAVRALVGTDSAAKREVAQRVAADADLRREVMRRVQALPDSQRTVVMREGMAMMRGGAAGGPGGRGARGAEPNLRPAEAPLGGSDESEFAQFFGRGRRTGPMVQPGSYLVTINAGGQTMRQVISVERVTPIEEFNFGGEEEEGEEP